MILLVDNYDSFSYNLYQIIGEVNSEIKVIRNDELTINEIERLNPDHIVISPGPGRPKNAGISIDIVKNFYDKIPILGVCLGHQSIYEAFGGKVDHSKTLVHGKTSIIRLNNEHPLFSKMKTEISAGRYHSLSAIEETLPSNLEIIATSDDGEIMAISNKEHPIYGLQFHPESILTPEGNKIIENFLKS
ncbi:aminodeoxychorismate/anthranilate synthase component 2 [Methanobrevibacter cuticularis]|uniref:anthranilate synthase n=1 Tax=Methanobrevibacter cuticularis TaxID=47311 RepID=A0A166CS93_9EURY|nr:aminodeoxychorismate/anthranilate synthase component II [Methanobrevibacter cuticularis]KZX14809.1 aminodeoxychorismate/anthranilate synthase component 2 [Methanobrevibacter cuticularis]